MEKRQTIYKLRITTDDLKNFILMGLIATQDDIYRKMIDPGGLSDAIYLIEASYDFGDDFFHPRTGKGFERLNSIKTDMALGKSLVECVQEFYKVGDPNHPAIVDRILQAISK